MKKLICLALILALTAGVLSSCARRGGEDRAAEGEAPGASNDGPGYVATDGSVLSDDDADGVGGGQPTPEPVQTLSPQELAALDSGVNAPGSVVDSEEDDPDGVVFGTYDEENDTAPHAASSGIDTSTYQYAAVMDDNIDYTFNYPAHWEHVPGIYTVCYREAVEPGDFPARVAVTRKRLVHTPDDAAIMEQLTSYMRSVYKQYDASTFQTSTPDTDATFMGRRAFSNTYLAYWGDVEVKGFVIGAAVDRTLYVLHFCASYSDYQAMESMLQYIVRSVKMKEK